jgi:uncharacterized protein YlxW (UPF0749 family)
MAKTRKTYVLSKTSAVLVQQFEDNMFQDVYGNDKDEKAAKKRHEDAKNRLYRRLTYLERQIHDLKKQLNHVA